VCRGRGKKEGEKGKGGERAQQFVDLLLVHLSLE